MEFVGGNGGPIGAAAGPTPPSTLSHSTGGSSSSTTMSVAAGGAGGSALLTPPISPTRPHLSRWEMSHVQAWLTSIQCGQHAGRFEGALFVRWEMEAPASLAPWSSLADP